LNNLTQQTLVDLTFIISNDQSHFFAATQKLAGNYEFNTTLLEMARSSCPSLPSIRALRA
jgi:hypothetical protein